jgi:hypothetical protein
MMTPFLVKFHLKVRRGPFNEFESGNSFLWLYYITDFCVSQGEFCGQNDESDEMSSDSVKVREND